MLGVLKTARNKPVQADRWACLGGPVCGWDAVVDSCLTPGGTQAQLLQLTEASMHLHHQHLAARQTRATNEQA